MLDMSLAPIIAQKRAQNLGVAESAAVTYAAQHEGATQLADPGDDCDLDRTNFPAIEITCTEGKDTKYEQSVSRSFRLDLDNTDSGDNTTTPTPTRTFDIPPPPGFTGHQCQSWTQMGTSGHGSAWNGTEWTGNSCMPQEAWSNSTYVASDPDVWYWDITGVNGRGIHPDF
jgi:hypothetical protein